MDALKDTKLRPRGDAPGWEWHLRMHARHTNVSVAFVSSQAPEGQLAVEMAVLISVLAKGRGQNGPALAGSFVVYLWYSIYSGASLYLQSWSRGCSISVFTEM